VDKIYFLYGGILGYVLPEMGDSIFGLGETGDLIGLIDLIPDEDMGEVVGNTQRKFTVQCLTDWCEFLCLMVHDFDSLKSEFPDIFDELFDNAMRKYRRLLKAKKKAIYDYKNGKGNVILGDNKMKIKDLLVNKKRIRKLHPSLMNRQLSRTIVDMNDDDGFDAIEFDEKTALEGIEEEDSVDDSELDMAMMDKISPGLDKMKTNMKNTVGSANSGSSKLKDSFKKKGSNNSGPDTQLILDALSDFKKEIRKEISGLKNEIDDMKRKI